MSETAGKGRFRRIEEALDERFDRFDEAMASDEEGGEDGDEAEGVADMLAAMLAD